MPGVPHLKSDCDVRLGRRRCRLWLLYIHAHLAQGEEGEWSAVPLVLLPHLVVSELWGSRFIAQVETAGEQHR